MNLSSTADGRGRTTDFMILAASWYGAGAAFSRSPAPAGATLAWVLLTSALSMAVLGAVRYFEWHVPKSDVSGALSLFVALPLSAILAMALFALARRPPVLAVPAAIRASVWAALAVEVSRWLVFRAGRRKEKRWGLKTLLRPGELEGLSAQIEASGASEWIHVRPCDLSAEGEAALRGDETIVISRGAALDLKTCAALVDAHIRGQRIIDVTQLLKQFRGRVRLRNADAWTFLLGSMYQSLPIRAYFLLKTFLEPLLAAVLVVLASPLGLALAAAVLWSSGRPVLYRQERLGYRGRRFGLLKFRTMTTAAESGGPAWARENDARTTPVGRWLRATHLDELPQLLNVAKRELSFVGPRPERPEFYKLLSEHIPLFSLRLLVRPGITGWAQSKQRYAGTVEESKTKLEYDLYYIQHMSPALDLQVLMDTAGILIRGNGGR